MAKPRIPLPKQTEQVFRDKKSQYDRRAGKAVSLETTGQQNQEEPVSIEEMLEKIEGHLGCNWKEEYPGIEKLKGKALREALEAICTELK